jgi:hypothetical protein
MPPPNGRLGPGYLTDEEKKNRPKVTKGLIKRIFSYLKPYRLQLVFVLAAILCSAVLTLPTASHRRYASSPEHVNEPAAFQLPLRYP